MTSYKCYNCKHFQPFYSKVYKKLIPICDKDRWSDDRSCIKDYEPIEKEVMINEVPGEV